MKGIRIIISKEMLEAIREVIDYFKRKYGIDISSSSASKLIAEKIKKDGKLLKIELVDNKGNKDSKNKSFFDIKTR